MKPSFTIVHPPINVDTSYLIYVCDYEDPQIMAVFDEFCQKGKLCVKLDVQLICFRVLLTCMTRSWLLLASRNLTIYLSSTVATTRNTHYLYNKPQQVRKCLVSFIDLRILERLPSRHSFAISHFRRSSRRRDRSLPQENCRT